MPTDIHGLAVNKDDVIWVAFRALLTLRLSLLLNPLQRELSDHDTATRHHRLLFRFLACLAMADTAAPDPAETLCKHGCGRTVRLSDYRNISRKGQSQLSNRLELWRLSGHFPAALRGLQIGRTFERFWEWVNQGSHSGPPPQRILLPICVPSFIVMETESVEIIGIAIQPTTVCSLSGLKRKNSWHCLL